MNQNKRPHPDFSTIVSTINIQQENESCSGCSMEKACQKKGKRCQAYSPSKRVRLCDEIPDMTEPCPSACGMACIDWLTKQCKFYKKAEPEMCVWDIRAHHYRTSCDMTISVDLAIWRECDGWAFCPYCGKKIKIE